MEYRIGESLAILFRELLFLSFLGHEAIVYQANPQRGDKISDPRVRQDLQFALSRILQSRLCPAQSSINVAGVAHQLGRAVRQALYQLSHALECQLSGLRNPAKMIGRGNT